MLEDDWRSFDAQRDRECVVDESSSDPSGETQHRTSRFVEATWPWHDVCLHSGRCVDCPKHREGLANNLEHFGEVRSDLTDAPLCSPGKAAKVLILVSRFSVSDGMIYSSDNRYMTNPNPTLNA